MLELTFADGKELDIPQESLLMFEEMREDTNPNFPSARSFIRYALGTELRMAILSTKADDIIFELGLNANPAGWLKLTRQSDGRRYVTQSKFVMGRLGLEEGCELTLQYGSLIDTVTVNESRREIKKWSEKEPTNGQSIPDTAD